MVFSIIFITLLLIETSLTISYSQPIENSIIDSGQVNLANPQNTNVIQKNINEEKPSPLQQATQGIFPTEIECEAGNVLLIKLNQNSPACVAPETAKKLITRSWGIPSTTIALSQSNEIKVKSLVEETMAECRTDHYCFTDSIRYVAETEKKFITLRTYVGIIDGLEESFSYCHDMGHHLGMFLYDYIDDLPETLFYADQRCGLSQIHGAVEKFFKKNFSDADPQTIRIEDICPKINDNVYLIDRWACLHGMGHGLTISYEYDIFPAINRCDELDSRLEKMSCSTGVFMENIDEFLRSSGGTFDETDIFFPCNKVDLEYSPGCYHYQTNYIQFQPDYTVESGFKKCDMIEPKEFIKYCYYGMGRINSVNSFENYENALKFCNEGDEDYQKYCFTGLLSTLVTNLGTDQGLEYCEFLPFEFKEECYSVMGKWVIMYYSSEMERQTECLKAENIEFSKVCINASLENFALL